MFGCVTVPPPSPAQSLDTPDDTTDIVMDSSDQE